MSSEDVIGLSGERVLVVQMGVLTANIKDATLGDRCINVYCKDAMGQNC